MTGRQALIAAAAGAALMRCGRTARQFPVTNVSIVKAAGYTMDVYDTVYRMVLITISMCAASALC